MSGVDALQRVGRPALVAARSGHVVDANAGARRLLDGSDELGRSFGDDTLELIGRVIDTGEAEIAHARGDWLVSPLKNGVMLVALESSLEQARADAVASLLGRLARGERIAELCRDLAHLAADAAPDAHAIIEVREGDELVLCASWPGRAPDEPSLVEALPPGYSEIPGPGERRGGAFAFTVRDSAVRGVLALFVPGLASPRDQVSALGAVLGALVSWWDADRRARDLAERYRLVSEATHHVLYDWDIVTDTVTWSPRLRDLFGHAPGDDERTLSWWKKQLHPDDAERITASLDRALKAGDLYWLGEYRFARGDGTWAWVLDRGSLVHEQRRPVRLVGVMEDLSREREAQEQLARAARLATVGTMAAGVAHEINNPLAWVTSNLGFALEELAHLAEEHGEGEHIDEATDALEDAKAGALRISQIVNDLKTFTHADNEVAHPVSVTRAIESALAMGGNELRHRVRLVKRLDTVPHVLANKARLGQAVLNVVLHAAGTLGEQATGRPKEIVVSTRTQSGGVCIEIADNGLGIAAEVLPRIFDPFFTAHAGEGLGIGLAVTQGIVKALGGTIEADSRVGEGTTFRIWLPAAVQRAESPTGEVPIVAPPPGAVRRASIVVIDDEGLILQAFERILGSVHAVHGFESAEHGLAALAAAPADLIFCDLHMPGLSGPQFFERLSASSPTLADRCVFMTGGAFTPESRAFLAVVRPTVLEKPFTVEALRHLVAERITQLDARTSAS